MIFRSVTLALSLALAPINPLLLVETLPTTKLEFTCIGDDNTDLVARVIDTTTQKVAVSNTTDKARQSPPAIVFPTEYFREDATPQELCIQFAQGFNKKVEDNNGSLENLYLTSGIVQDNQTKSGRQVICVVQSEEELCISSQAQTLVTIKSEYRRFAPDIIKQIENFEAGVAEAPATASFDSTYVNLEVMFGNYLELNDDVSPVSN